MKILIRLFSKVVKKQILTPFFVFCFLILSENPFLRGSKNKKWVKNYLTLVSLQKRGSFSVFRESENKKQIFVRWGGLGKGGAAVEGLNGKVIDFNANFSQTYSFVYFEIFSIVEARYSENMGAAQNCGV